MWLNLQKRYDEKLIEIENEKDLDAQVGIVKNIDYSFFETVADLPASKNNYEKITNLCGYLTVSNLNILLQQVFLVNFKKGVPNFETKNVINSKAWIQTAINYSKSIDTKPFNAERLKAYLPELRAMTIQKPEEFIPRMSQIFADCGVAFVLLPHLRNSGVNGAVKWVSNDRVVLAMNNRGLYADKFWFSLFHEIKHVLQQKVTKVFISGSELDLVELNQSLEEEADNFATNYLIPASAMKRFAPDRYTSDDEIVDFAKSIGIHPGIVAGRLQHDKIIPQTRCAKLKEKYVIMVSA